ncbi:hypothetical protein ACOMHN_051653 [Nucella lapillus]
MAHFGRDDSFSAARTVQITGSETNENFTSYTIEVTVGSYSWTVKHRYSEFHELHEKLVSSHKVDKGLLPPKKLFGNQTESFVKRRQQDLQLYLQTVLNLLALHPPPALTAFLHFNLYEIHGITQTMAEDLYNRGELLLHSDQVYRVTPLQLHSLTERLKLPEPTCDSGDVKKDLGHILDFITRTRHLQVVGTSEWVGTSTINMNLLPFDLSLFKSLHTLEVENCRFDMVQGLETTKQTLHILKVYHTASTVKEMVLQDVPQWKGEDGSQLVSGWDHATTVDFSHNFIKHIDSSVEALWRVEHLDLSHNQLEGVQHLQWLSHMTHLNLAHNRLRLLDTLHTKLGNLKCLLLQGNRIETLQGFSKLFSLEVLDVSDNNIAKVEDVRPVCHLPCMESLRLTENPVTLTVDYRTRILEMFGDRVGEVCLDGEKASQKEKDTVAVCLDGEKASQKEKDTVAVRLALQKARDARSRHNPAPRKNSSPAPLCDVRGGRGGTPPPPSRYSPLPPCGAALSSSSAVGQGPRAENSLVSTSAPHHSLPRQWSQPNMPHTSTPTISAPGHTSPAKTPASGQEMRGEGAHLPTPIPEAHPFDPSSDSAPSPPPLTRQEYAACDLPSTSCPDFVTWLHTHLLAADHTSTSTPTLTATTSTSTTSVPTTSACDPNFTTPALSATSSSHNPAGSHQPPTQRMVSVLWCYAQFYSSPTSIFPCCAVLTTSALLLQRLSGRSIAAERVAGGEWMGLGKSATAENRRGVAAREWAGVGESSAAEEEDRWGGAAAAAAAGTWPGLGKCLVLPLNSIQHVVVGPGYSFLRVEEAFVGPEGLLTLFALDVRRMREFAEGLQDCCTQLDPSNPLDILDLLCQSDLLTEVCHREKRDGLVSDYLAFTLLVRVRRGEEAGGRWCLLVMSENVVYLLDVGCVYWPPATFQASQNGTLSLQVVEELSILCDITHLSLHSPYHPLPEDSENMVDFTSLPLTLNTQGGRQVTLLFSIGSSRQAFVDHLNRMRARHGQEIALQEVPESNDNADLADSSFQSCRSRCSAGVDNGVMPATAGEGPAQPFESPLNDQGQDSAPSEGAECAQGLDVGGEGSLSADPSMAGERSGGQSKVDLENNVEPEVHDLHALSHSDNGEGHPGHDGKHLQHVNQEKLQEKTIQVLVKEKMKTIQVLGKEKMKTIQVLGKEKMKTIQVLVKEKMKTIQVLVKEKMKTIQVLVKEKMKTIQVLVKEKMKTIQVLGKEKMKTIQVLVKEKMKTIQVLGKEKMKTIQVLGKEKMKTIQVLGKEKMKTIQVLVNEKMKTIVWRRLGNIQKMMKNNPTAARVVFRRKGL